DSEHIASSATRTPGLASPSSGEPFSLGSRPNARGLHLRPLSPLSHVEHAVLLAVPTQEAHQLVPPHPQAQRH
ncbi:uncharacterized protein RHOBADRAFT_49524, partial [Rhodotorula graminis WP1]